MVRFVAVIPLKERKFDKEQNLLALSANTKVL